jgi:hypothetical protein
MVMILFALAVLIVELAVAAAVICWRLDHEPEGWWDA